MQQTRISRWINRSRMGIAAVMVAIFGLTGVAQSAEKMRWGGDQEGGGPYIFPEEDDPTKIVGFEVDLARALAEKLGWQSEFVQSNWDQLLPVLDRGNIDLVVNGYEFTRERNARFLASIPYYIYELGLCARRNDSSIVDWTSLETTATNGRRKRIGVLGGSAGDLYVTNRFEKNCDVVRYESSTEALRLVESGQIDATVQDMPILHFYVEHLARHPELAIIDQPVAEGYYVIYVRPADKPLIDQIDLAIRELYESGELQSLYERYGIWNATQKKLPDTWARWDSGIHETGRHKWLELSRQAPLLLRAAGTTVLLSALAMPLAILIGLGTALGRSSGLPALGGAGTAESWTTRLLRLPLTVYVEIVRGTPLAFQLFVIYFILPEIGIRINEFWAGVMALAVNYSAYESEIFRLGLQAIPKGQMEAALSLGMPRWLAIRRIVLPQAVRIVIPATANDFIALFKDTAVCSVIAVEELSKQYSMGAKSTGLFLEMAALTSLLYLLMSYPLSLLAGWLEQRLKSGTNT